MGESYDASLRDFETELSQLRNSKNSIKAITKVAMSSDPLQVARRIAERVASQAGVDSDRVVLLYVVDSICKCAALKGLNSLIDAFRPHVSQIAQAVACSPGASQDTINTVHKVLGYWVQRDLFSSEMVQAVQQKLPPGAQAKILSDEKLNHGSRPPRPDKTSSGGKRKGPPSIRREHHKSEHHRNKKSATEPKLEISLQPAKPPTAAATGDHTGAERERRNQDYNNRYSHEESSHNLTGGFDDLWADPTVPSPHPKPLNNQFTVPDSVRECLMRESVLNPAFLDRIN